MNLFVIRYGDVILGSRDSASQAVGEARRILSEPGGPTAVSIHKLMLDIDGLHAELLSSAAQDPEAYADEVTMGINCSWRPVVVMERVGAEIVKTYDRSGAVTASPVLARDPPRDRRKMRRQVR